MLIEAITKTVFGIPYFITGNDDLNVAAGIVVTSLGESPDHTTEFDAIMAFQGQHTFTISGTVNGYDEAITTIGCTLAQTIIIYAGGVLNGGVNSPAIDAEGVVLDGLNSTLTNHGEIHATGSGIAIRTPTVNGVTGTTIVTNNGLIETGKYGIWVKFEAGATRFVNTGTVESLLDSYFGGVGIDEVINSGTMNGAVTLGRGNDIFRGTTGFVGGTINGGDGNDTFFTGTQAETIDGGIGSDTLDFSGVKSGITVDLSGLTENLGARVDGDIYTGIEVIKGTNYNDILTGDGSANLLIGNAGVDILSGGLGNDTVQGGRGIDNLTGGQGLDVFVFTSTTGLKDVITDFDETVDVIRLEGSAFGYGSYAGAVLVDDFVIGAQPQALDETDRFLFRTGDSTLWFDADGNGAVKRILVADLQDGALLSEANLLIA